MVLTETSGTSTQDGTVKTLFDVGDGSTPVHFATTIYPKPMYSGDKFRVSVFTQDQVDDIYRSYITKEFGFNDLKPKSTDIKVNDYLENLVARIKLDGDLLDSSGNGNNGTINYGPNFISWWTLESVLTDTIGTQNLSLTAGTQTFLDFPFGKSLSFDGLTYYSASDTPYDFEHTDPFSLECWVKLDQLVSNNVIVAKGTDHRGGAGTIGYYLFSNGNNDFIRFRLHDGTTAFDVDTAVLAIDTWYHVVATYDGSSNQDGMKIYLNGVLQNTGATSTISTTILNNENLTIGGESDGGVLLNGDIGHVKIYSSELSSVQATELYRKNTKTNFDNGIGTEAFHGIGHESFTFATEANFDLDRTDTQSYSFWGRIPSTTAGVIYAKNSGTGTTGTQIEFDSTGKLKIRLINTATSNEINVIIVSAQADDQIHLWTITYDGSSSSTGIVIYKDGSVVSNTDTTNTLSATILNNNTPTVGSHSDSTVFFTGLIQDFRVYDVKLTSGQASQIYNTTRAFYDPILFMKFENNVIDSSSQGNDGTVSGTTLFDQGQVEEKSFRFDGASQIDIINSAGSKYRFHNNQPFSIGFWIKPDESGSSNDAVIVKTENTEGVDIGYSITYDHTNNDIEFRIKDGTTAFSVSDTTITADIWHYIVVTYGGTANQSGMKIYTDGVLISTGSASTISNEVLNVLDFMIGDDNAGSANLLGLIDELKIWNYELLADEVKNEAGNNVESIYVPMLQSTKYKIEIQQTNGSPRDINWNRYDVS